MKKILLMALMAATMVGCSQNEEIENAGEKSPIKLGAVVKASTKAAVTDNATFNTFTVIGYITDAEMTASSALGTAFIPATKIEKSGNEWTTTELDYYWPYQKKVQFFATSPAQTVDTPTAGYPTFDYTIKGTSALQEDLVAAKKIDQTKDAEDVAANGVVLPFTHALTQINFSVKGADAYTYKVSSITIEGVSNKGTYSFENAQWTKLAVDGEAPVYKYPLMDNASVTGVTGVPVGAVDAALMLMPQSMPDTDGAGIVTVIYQVFNKEIPISEVFTATADLKGSTAWTPATKIRYTITLDNKGSKITLGKPSVGDWATADTGVELPKKP